MYRVAEDDTAYNFVVESESGMTAREVDGRVLKLERVFSSDHLISRFLLRGDHALGVPNNEGDTMGLLQSAVR
jgi:hypothetical protein